MFWSVQIIIRRYLPVNNWHCLGLHNFLLYIGHCHSKIKHVYIICIKETITYFLTPRCRVLLEKLTGLQLITKCPAFHGTRRFITALTSVRHLPLSWASPIQSIYPHPTSWRSVPNYSPIYAYVPSGLLPSGFPPRPYTHPLFSHTRHMPSPI